MIFFKKVFHLLFLFAKDPTWEIRKVYFHKKLHETAASGDIHRLVDQREIKAK